MENLFEIVLSGILSIVIVIIGFRLNNAAKKADSAAKKAEDFGQWRSTIDEWKKNTDIEMGESRNRGKWEGEIREWKRITENWKKSTDKWKESNEKTKTDIIISINELSRRVLSIDPESAKQNAKKVKVFQPYIENITNPISIEEKDKFESLRKKAELGKYFAIEEYREFKLLADKISIELPENKKGEFDNLISDLLKFILGKSIENTVLRQSFVLKTTTYFREKKQPEFWKDHPELDGRKLYDIRLIIDSEIPGGLEKVDHVEYCLPGYPKPNKNPSPRNNYKDKFLLKELAYGGSTVYAKVFLKGEEESIELQKYISLEVNGPRFIRGFIIKANANLKLVNLSKTANLIGADMTGANLTGADLSESDLTGADLKKANLMEAKLINTTLEKTNLKGTDLRGIKINENSLNSILKSDNWKYAIFDSDVEKKLKDMSKA